MLLITEVMEYRQRIGLISVRLDVGRPDNLPPLLGIVGPEFPELRWRQRHGDAAQLGKSCPDLRIGKAGIDLAIELLDDLLGRVSRRTDPVPKIYLVAWHKLADGRHLGQRLPARRRGHAERTQLAGSDIFKGRHHIAERGLYLPADRIGQRGWHRHDKAHAPR